MPTENWITNGGSLANQRYSPLTQIDTTNVGAAKAFLVHGEHRGAGSFAAFGLASGQEVQGRGR